MPIYSCTWCNKWLTAEAKTIADMVEQLREAADELEAMQRAGVKLDPQGCPDDYAYLYTKNAKVAKRFGFERDKG